MSPPSQAKVHRVLLLGVLTDTHHVFRILRNFQSTLLHVSFRLLVPNKERFFDAEVQQRKAIRVYKSLQCVPILSNKKRHPRETSVLKM